MRRSWLLILLCVMGNGNEARHDKPPSRDKRLVCMGENVERYDTSKADCINGTVVTRQPSTEPSSRSTTTSPRNRPTSTLTTGSCVKPEDLKENQCYGQTLCDGFQCCGVNATYYPLTSTCCRQMHRVEIFHKPEKNHVCCYQGKTTVHRRGTQPCLHPATNDKLFKKLLKYKLMGIHLHCNLRYAYLVKELKTPSGEDSRYEGSITLQQVYPYYLNQTVFHKRVDFDQYSTIKPIEKDSLLVLSTVDQTYPNRIKFFTYSNDQVYKIPFCSRRPKRLYNHILRNVLKNNCAGSEKLPPRRHKTRKGGARSRSKSSRIS